MSYNDVFYSEYSNCVAIVHKETIYGSSMHKIQGAMTSYNQTKNKKILSSYCGRFHRIGKMKIVEFRVLRNFNNI